MYIGFWLRDLTRLQSLLISLLGMSAILNNVSELGQLQSHCSTIPPQLPPFHTAGIPSISLWLKLHSKKTDQPSSSSSSRSSDSTSINDQLLAKELARSLYSLGDDYMELLLQYGYLSCFAVAFPLAPLLAFLNNLFEGRVDRLKLSTCRRPLPSRRWVRYITALDVIVQHSSIDR